MKSVLTAAQMKALEKITMEDYGIPSETLIENAARAAFEALMDLNVKNVLIFAGSGNNGADGFALAVLFLKNSLSAEVCFTGNPSSRTVENASFEKKYTDIGGKVINISEIDKEKKYDAVVDGIFGIGLNRGLSDEYRTIVDLINEKEGIKLALDIPSGLSADTGNILNASVKANYTVCFGAYKKGLLINEGPNVTGKIILAPAGIVSFENLSEAKANLPFEVPLKAVEKEDLGKMIYKRPANGNKGTFGKVLTVAGSPNMKGAGILSARGCFSVGAGMVKVMSAKVNGSDYLNVCPELMMSSYDDITEANLQKEIDWCDVCVAGPGLSINGNTKRITEYLIKECRKPLLLDADGLNILSENPTLLTERAKCGFKTILTPHPGEFQRLFKAQISDRLFENPEFLRQKAGEYGAVIVAKSARTMISDEKTTYINLYGNSGLGRAGSGDILSGVIGGLLFNSKDETEAAVLGVMIHSLGGDKAADKYGEYSVESCDIIEGIRETMKECK